MGTTLKNWYFLVDENLNVLDIVETETDYLFDRIDENTTLEEIKKILNFDKRKYYFDEGVLYSEPLKPVQTEEEVRRILEEMLRASLSNEDHSEVGKVNVSVTGANIDFTVDFKNEFLEPPVVNFNLLDPTTNRTVVIKEVTTTNFTIKSSYFRTAQEVHYTAYGKLKKGEE